MLSVMWTLVEYIIAFFSFLLGVGTLLFAFCSLIPIVIDSIIEAKEAIKELKGDGE